MGTTQQTNRIDLQLAGAAVGGWMLRISPRRSESGYFAEQAANQGRLLRGPTFTKWADDGRCPDLIF